ncbi:MAG TPA: patatin-like phospholipase family protein [Rudaea sp.]|nr:patatin-like phospholipase family protein [Rudaea sp.]HSC09671.1 patatin-like phospholipase family protein [Rhodanobacteraceae bacterium]
MTGPSVSLVLGSGGARGYAHIGVIEELVAQGFDIRSVAGSSMGALVGGVYAAGQLDAFRDWVKPLQRFDVLRLLDWTISGGGLIKGDRIIDKLRGLIGEVNIEDLPIAFTAVAVDLMSQREVWFSRGSLFDAIRASIAIPTILRPHYYEGRTLVDGGLLNPVPITPTLRDLTDCTIAVDINAAAEQLGDAADASTTAAVDSTFGSVAGVLVEESSPVQASMPDGEAAPAGETNLPAVESPPPSYRQRIADFVNGLVAGREKNSASPDDPGLLELFARSLDVVQETITRFKLAAQPPDLIIRIPRNVCAFYEFHRAEEVIELGRERTRDALLHWQRPNPRVG